MVMMGVWAGGSYAAARQIGRNLSNPRPTPINLFPKNYDPYSKQEFSKSLKKFFRTLQEEREIAALCKIRLPFTEKPSGNNFDFEKMMKILHPQKKHER
jgi:hypothetical protein